MVWYRDITGLWLGSVFALTVVYLGGEYKQKVCTQWVQDRSACSTYIAIIMFCVIILLHVAD